MRACRTIAEMRAALEPCREGTIGLVPTMGALHAGHRLAARGRPRGMLDGGDEPLRQPGAVRRERRLAAYPRDEARDLRRGRRGRRRSRLRADGRGDVPAGLPDLGRRDGARLGPRRRHRPGHFRGVATVCLKLFTIVRPDTVYFGQKDAQQVAVLRRLIADLALEIELRATFPPSATPDGLALSSRNLLLSPTEREPALGLAAGALATRDPERARELLDGLEVDYVEIAPFDPPVLAAAVRVGSTRLIDNVPLEEDRHMSTRPRTPAPAPRPRQAPDHRSCSR